MKFVLKTPPTLMPGEQYINMKFIKKLNSVFILIAFLFLMPNAVMAAPTISTNI